jgi:hypothetical protein
MLVIESEHADSARFGRLAHEISNSAEDLPVISTFFKYVGIASKTPETRVVCPRYRQFGKKPKSISLLGQSKLAHEICVTGIRPHGVECRVADAENEFDLFV